MSIAEKAVLVSFAEHADHRGYSWPSVDRIAFTWSIDRRTVRRAIWALLVRHSLRPTRKRYGTTGQVRVYRLPKVTYESGGKMHRFENDRSGHKADTKGTISGGEMTPNKEQGIHTTRKINKKCSNKECGISLSVDGGNSGNSETETGVYRDSVTNELRDRETGQFIW